MYGPGAQAGPGCHVPHTRTCPVEFPWFLWGGGVWARVGAIAVALIRAVLGDSFLAHWSRWCRWRVVFTASGKWHQNDGHGT